MDIWVKDIIGLTLALDSLLAVGIVGWSCWAAWTYDYMIEPKEYIYRNYNYEIKAINEEVKNEPTSN